MNKLTTEEIDSKKNELQTKYGEIHVIEVEVKAPENETDPGDYAYAFLRKPKRSTILLALDKTVIQEPSVGAEVIFNSSIIKDVSDPRTYGNDSENEPIVLSCITQCMTYVQVYKTVLKKK